jgi:hypothetical protein
MKQEKIWKFFLFGADYIIQDMTDFKILTMTSVIFIDLKLSNRFESNDLNHIT